MKENKNFEIRYRENSVENTIYLQSKSSLGPLFCVSLGVLYCIPVVVHCKTLLSPYSAICRARTLCCCDTCILPQVHQLCCCCRCCCCYIHKCFPAIYSSSSDSFVCRRGSRKQIHSRQYTKALLMSITAFGIHSEIDQWDKLRLTTEQRDIYECRHIIPRREGQGLAV